MINRFSIKKRLLGSVVGAICLYLVSVGLAGCGSSKGAADITGEEEAEPTAEEPTAEEPVAQGGFIVSPGAGAAVGLSSEHLSASVIATSFPLARLESGNLILTNLNLGGD